MLRISLQRFAQFATGRIRRDGHDSAIYETSCRIFIAQILHPRVIASYRLLQISSACD
jgi:hypothetical protein